MNIGTRPTFDNSDKVVIEVYLYDFNDDIYDKEVTVFMLNRMRDELKYSSREELIAQMEIDKLNGIELKKKITN